MGWPAVARIWWPMWLQNRQEVIDRILAEVDSAEAQLDREPGVGGRHSRTFAVTTDRSGRRS